MAKDDKPYLYEFLYRGRPPGAKEEPAWQITLGVIVPDPFGGPATHREQTLNIEQAKAAGWGLPKIVEEINAEALVVAEQARADLSRVQALAAELERQLKVLESERNLIARGLRLPNR